MKLVVAISLAILTLFVLTVIVQQILIYILNALQSMFDSTVTNYYSFINFASTNILLMGFQSGISEVQLTKISA